MTQPVIAFVVNGGPDSAMGERARAFAARLPEFAITLQFRTAGTARSVPDIVRSLFALRPDGVYVFDLAAAGVLAALAYRTLTGTPFVVDTGDDIVQLGRVLGRGPIGMTATRTLEAAALRTASHLVVRGTAHAEWLRTRGIRSTVIPDGVVVEDFAEFASSRPAHQPLTLGVVGSVVWVPSRQTCYGWELVEVLHHLRGPFPVRGILIGDGSGIEHLRRRAAELGVSERMEFVGRVPYAELPRWLQQVDIAISTQTNDRIGQVRTTGKLPLYLAAGRFVLASRVGEAARVLPPEMLVDFYGSVDPGYPARLAEHIRRLRDQGEDFRPRADRVELARQHFAYDRLADRVRGVLHRELRIRGTR